MSQFIYEISNYISDNTSLIAGTDFFIGELPRVDNGAEGVFAVSAPSQEPDYDINTEYKTIDFWARYKESRTCLEKLQEIFELIHQAHNYQTTSWYVFFSHAAGQIDDMDRDAEGGKLMRLSVIFIYRDLNQIS